MKIIQKWVKIYRLNILGVKDLLKTSIVNHVNLSIYKVIKNKLLRNKPILTTE